MFRVKAFLNNSRFRVDFTAHTIDKRRSNRGPTENTGYLSLTSITFLIAVSRLETQYRRAFI